ncbi:MAG: 3'-5' exonuclease [Gammaproteobacteria bacterium]|nr:MAG: 3'-5' exonuclease [Gammaproteobacteria bacterium]
MVTTQGSAGEDWATYLASRQQAAKDPRLQAFFQAFTARPGMTLEEAPLIALDVETTGLDPRRHSIISIGVVPFDLDRIRFSQRRQWLLKPRFPLESHSVTLHHITHADLAHAPDLDEVLEDLLQAMAGRLPVVHYRSIERRFLESAIRFRLGESLVFPVIDTMALEARFHRQPLSARIRRWLGGGQLSLRLQDCRARYGLPGYSPHHAVIDALATAELLQAQVAARLGRNARVGELWC